MTQIMEFSQRAKEEIHFYVYGLRHPNKPSYFYIGKGERNRVFAHIQEAKEGLRETPKLNTIRRILDEGIFPEIDIIRHGLDENEAYLLEATLIDVLDVENLTNVVKGHGSGELGIMSAQNLDNEYSKGRADISFPAIIIKINRNFKYRMSKKRLYEVTRNSWIVGEKRNKVTHAISVANGVIREVYKIDRWEKATIGCDGNKLSSDRRWEFFGKPDDDPGKQKLIGHTVSHLQSRGAQNPIMYVNVE